MQSRDAVYILTLTRLINKKLCPRSALKALQSLYPFNNQSPLFQWKGSAGWGPLIDSKVRKTLERLNVALGLNPLHFTVSVDLVLPCPLTPMSQFKVSKYMVLGLLTACGNTYRQTSPQASN